MTVLANESLTRTVAEWVVASRDAPLPAVVEHHVTRLLVDYFAAVIPGSATAVSRGVAGHVLRNYGGSGATAVGAGTVSALGAAFLNGSSAHGLEVDDGYTPGSVHPSSVAFPSVLAAAEAEGSSREVTIRALAVALEATCRIAAAGHPATWRNHFHNTPIAGVMGAACGVAVIHGLTKVQVLDALGIAGSHAGGLFAFLNQSAEVKRIHPGKASRDAIASVELAQAGVTGPRAIFEGAHGYIETFARGEFDDQVLISGLGRDWVFLNTYVKPYPSCRHLHGPIDAVLELRKKHAITPSSVANVTVRTYTVASHHGNQKISSFLDAQMSIPYAVAVALKHGVVGLDEFDGDNRGDAEVSRLTGLVTVVADGACDARYPALRPAVVEIELAGGVVHTEKVEQPYGEPTNPVSDSDISAKFLRLAGPALGAEAQGILDRLWKFDSLHILSEIQDSIKASR